MKTINNLWTLGRTITDKDTQTHSHTHTLTHRLTKTHTSRQTIRQTNAWCSNAHNHSHNQKHANVSIPSIRSLSSSPFTACSINNNSLAYTHTTHTYSTYNSTYIAWVWRRSSHQLIKRSDAWDLDEIPLYLHYQRSYYDNNAERCLMLMLFRKAACLYTFTTCLSYVPTYF